MRPKRKIRIEGDIAFVPLTKGYEAVIDAEDVDKVCDFNWIAAVTKWTVYAQRAEQKNGKKKTIRMHRFLSDAPKGKEVDHIDRNGLNNRKSNLRICNRSENICNTVKRSTNKSGFKGVVAYRDKWVASITKNGKQKHLGVFDTKEEAYMRYCESSKEMHKEFSRV